MRTHQWTIIEARELTACNLASSLAAVPQINAESKNHEDNCQKLFLRLALENKGQSCLPNQLPGLKLIALKN